MEGIENKPEKEPLYQIHFPIEGEKKYFLSEILKEGRALCFSANNNFRLFIWFRAGEQEDRSRTHQRIDNEGFHYRRCGEFKLSRGKKKELQFTLRSQTSLNLDGHDKKMLEDTIKKTFENVTK